MQISAMISVQRKRDQLSLSFSLFLFLSLYTFLSPEVPFFSFIFALRIGELPKLRIKEPLFCDPLPENKDISLAINGQAGGRHFDQCYTRLLGLQRFRDGLGKESFGHVAENN